MNKRILLGVIVGITFAGFLAAIALGLILVGQLILGDSTVYVRILAVLFLAFSIVIGVYKEVTQPDADKTD